MIIYISRGESRDLHFTLTPVLPVDGKAEDWKFVSDTDGNNTHVTDLDIRFSPDSSASERLSETLTIKIGLDGAVQTDTSVWRFAPRGFIFATGHGDDKRCFEIEDSIDGAELVLKISCLDDAGEEFKFSFLAMNTDLVSGECKIFASADPAGKVGRGG